MKTIEIIGYKRANLGTSDAEKLRREGQVPCVLYGGKEQMHFHVPLILFRDLLYTNDAHFVNLDIEGKECKAILQDVQFHPVSDVIIHADFMELHEGKPIKMEIPVHLVGSSPAVATGGILVPKKRKLKIKALPKNMPSYVEADLKMLDFGKPIRVGMLKEDNFQFLDAKQISVVTVEVPRALRGKTASAEEGEANVEEESEASA